MRASLLLPLALPGAALCALVFAGCEADPIVTADRGLVDATPDRGPLPDATPPDPDAALPDAEADAALPDAEADAAPDAGLDAASDAAALDAEFDAALLDAEPDTAVEPDAEPDAAEDATPDQDPLGPDLGPRELDDRPVACQDPGYQPGACVPGMGRQQEDLGGAHLAQGPIVYEYSPPVTGPHRPQWGRWGEYSYLPPQRYLHNLEHGGIALLYHPCAPPAMIEALRALARARPDDDTGPFRWVLTPYPDLPTPIAVGAWGWLYEATCVDPATIGTFIDRFYRTAPEDIAGDGGFSDRWIGR